MRKTSSIAAGIAALALGLGGAGAAFADVAPDEGQSEDVAVVLEAEADSNAVDPASAETAGPEGQQSSDEPGVVNPDPNPNPPQSGDENENNPEEVTGEILSVTRDGCTVTIKVKTTGVGEFAIEVWDDDENIDTITWNMEGSGEHTVTWYITEPAGTKVPGVGFYLVADDNELDSVDPFEYPAYVAGFCGGEEETPIVETPGTNPEAGVVAGTSFGIEGIGFAKDEEVVFTLVPFAEDEDGDEGDDEGAGTASVTAGGSVVVTGVASASAAKAGDEGQVVGKATAKANGEFEGTVSIPKDTKPGKYWLKATGEKSKKEVKMALVVKPASTVEPGKPTEKPSTTPSGSASSGSSDLAKTGAEGTGTLVLAGSALLLLGMTSLFTARRLRR